jgi:hypothetical protein
MVSFVKQRAMAIKSAIVSSRFMAGIPFRLNRTVTCLRLFPSELILPANWGLAVRLTDEHSQLMNQALVSRQLYLL